MNSIFSKLLEWLRKNGYFLAAFLIPLVVRSIPEVLSGPYPLGLDTLNVMPPILSGSVFSSGLIAFLHSNSMFYLFAGFFYALTHNIVFVIKFFGPVLLAILCSMMFLYARKGLDWSNRKSLLLSILIATYFVALRDSWDLYKQTLGLIFLMATLISLKSISSPRKYYLAGVFMVLTVLSHELASAILLFIIVFEAGKFLFMKSKKEFSYIAGSAILAIILFIFQRNGYLNIGTLPIPSSNMASEPSVGLSLFIIGLFFYCYILILPFVLLGIKGLRDSFLKLWILLCVGIPLIEILNPALSLYWERWVYLLVYPLLFYATHGIEKVWKFWSDHKAKIRRLVPKVFAITYLVLLLMLSGFYLTANPEKQISFFSRDNPYLTFIPSSMLQNTLPISDNPALVNCFEWINNNTTNDSAVVMHYALYDLAGIYISNRLLIAVNQSSFMWANLQNQTVLADGLAEVARITLSNGHGKAYTVWWVSGRGWYEIPSLPLEFREVFHSGNMAVYLFVPSI